MTSIEAYKTYCAFCRKDLTNAQHEYYKRDLIICPECNEILSNDPIDEDSPIVLFDDIPVLKADAKVLEYFENELNLPLPAITLRNFLTEDEVYGYLIEDNQVVGLGLDGANLESLSAIILNLTNLKYLSLKNNLLSELPSFINSLTNLEILDVTKNKIQVLPQMQNLHRLYHLGFRDNLIEDLPNLPPNLQTLNARWNRIRKITNPIPYSVKKINLAQNRLVELPVHFAHLEQLEELNVYGNQLILVPDIFAKLQKLKVLILRVNSITNLSNSIELAGSLETLDVEENKLDQLPNFSTLKNLRKLNISKNNLKEIMGLNGCVNLVNLDIRDNKFETLDITRLEKLQVLDISYNKFKRLPEGLKTKSLLIECIASGNQITEIEKYELEKLSSLGRLSLAKNCLTEIPDLSNLKKLHELYINDNKLNKLPEWIDKLKLRALTLDNNNFVDKEKKKEQVEVDNLTSWFD